MGSISFNEVNKIPYIDSKNFHGRALSTLSFYAEDDWHMWVHTEEELVYLKGHPVEGFYFSKQPENQSDVYFEFLNFIAQRSCWPEVIPCFHGIRDDLFNITASLKKFEILYKVSDQYKTGTSRFVVTELEYLFSLCRSIFDLLQEMISKQWRTVKLLDTSIHKKSLPQTFSKVVLQGESVRSAIEIVDKYSIPIKLAEFYERQGTFFQILRTFRDRFIHGGNSIDSILVTEKGFAVRENTQPFSTFDVWNTKHQIENNLCSLRPAIAHIVTKTLEACEDYAYTIQRVIQYPPEMVPEMLFYMRGPFTNELHFLALILEECQWWSDD